uniref:SCP domain-containing protein n=1 Tax=Caenorhabditis japonica TaxID=281687 RepID=A0A8R1I3U9_CAEJA
MQYSLVLLSLSVAGSFAQFSSTAQQAIVDVHNNLRSQIAKGTYVANGTKKESGADILKIKWDSSIGTTAQNYANTCPTGHSGTAGLGENLLWVLTTGEFEPLDSYAAHKEYGWTFNYLDLANFNSGIGHATQMAWSKTGSIGCGVRNCGPDASHDNWNKLVVVCQYKAPGNILNFTIYQTGVTCSACPSGTSCESASGLCI